MRLGLALAIVLSLCLFALRPVPAHQGSVSLIGRFQWDLEHPDFGGFSALHLSDDGAEMLAVTDRGAGFRVALERAEGRIAAAKVMEVAWLTDALGLPLEDDETDAEGIAVGADGTIFVSFERSHRIRRYDHLSGPGKVLPAPAAFDRMTSNAGLEALAIDAAGRLYTLPERPRSARHGFAVWRMDSSGWTRAFYLRPRGGFRSVAADIGPDGAFYLLERRVTFLGFQSRLRRWRLNDGGAEAEETLLITRPGVFDNLEGLSIRSAPNGELVLTMISDNNFLSLLRTDLVEFAAKEMLAP